MHENWIVSAGVFCSRLEAIFPVRAFQCLLQFSCIFSYLATLLQLLWPLSVRHSKSAMKPYRSVPLLDNLRHGSKGSTPVSRPRLFHPLGSWDCTCTTLQNAAAPLDVSRIVPDPLGPLAGPQFRTWPWPSYLKMAPKTPGVQPWQRY